jgi:hypothetical protein
VFDSRQQLWERVAFSVIRAQAHQAHYYNLGRVDRRFVVGDIVRPLEQPDRYGAFNIAPVWDPTPWVVVAVLSEVTYMMQSTANSRTLHVDHFRLAVVEADDPRRLAREAAAGQRSWCSASMCIDRQGHRQRRGTTWCSGEAGGTSARTRGNQGRSPQAHLLVAYERLAGLAAPVAGYQAPAAVLPVAPQAQPVLLAAGFRCAKWGVAHLLSMTCLYIVTRRYVLREGVL